jgi:predicted nuclease of predicted toxin-antitoxin system
VKILLDQNLPATVAGLLRQAGFDAIHARETGLSTAADEVILDWCRREDRIIFTHDADFHALLAVQGATRPSVVRIRIEGLSDVLLSELITKVSVTARQSLERGAVVSVTEGSIRTRHLPLKVGNE